MDAGNARATRLLHVMLRVRDLDASLAFYTGNFGMHLLRRDDYPDGRFTLAFVGYGEDSGQTVLELTHNWDQVAPYDPGNGFGHLAFAAADVSGLCAWLRARGVRITREAGPMKHGTRVIAFVEDPDGYRIELVERS